MRNTKTIEIDGREKPITVYELTVKQIIGFMQEDVWSSSDNSLDAFRKTLDAKILPIICTATLEDFIEMTPTDIDTVYKGFKEVNKVFFELAQKMGIQEMLGSVLVDIKQQLKKAITEDFSKFAVLSLKPDTLLS